MRTINCMQLCVQIMRTIMQTITIIIIIIFYYFYYYYYYYLKLSPLQCWKSVNALYQYGDPNPTKPIHRRERQQRRIDPALRHLYFHTIEHSVTKIIA